MQAIPQHLDQTIHQLRLGQIAHNPLQPRKLFDDEELLRLSESVKQHGILQPLVVRHVAEKDHYQLIAGERRLRAAQLLGLGMVPVHIVDFDDAGVMEAALAENIQRADLNPIEKAQGFQDYLDRFQMTHEQLANKLGVSAASVSHFVGLLQMPREVQDALRQGQMSVGHAKALKGLPVEKQVALGKDVVLRGLSVKALEAMVREMKQAKPARERDRAPAPEVAAFKTPHVASLEDSLRQKLATKFEIRLKDREKGAFVIHFENTGEFERIVEVLQR